MKVVVFVKATKGSEAGEMPSREMMEAMMAYNAELVAAGIMRAGDGLMPSSEGVRVHFSGKVRSVTDGPFVETKELVAGYWLREVGSMQEAIDWVKRCPNPMNEDSDIEILPLFEPEDFGEALTPELQKDWERLQAESEELAGRSGRKRPHGLRHAPPILHSCHTVWDTLPPLAGSVNATNVPA